MKMARMLTAVALIIGTSRVVSGQDGHDHAPGDQQLTQHDQLRIAVQEICPVSGEKLGEHGTPIKAKVGQETVYLCCEGCLQDKINPQHWATIHANIAHAQRICPIMKKALPKNPKWTIVDGQIVYVCCPGCTKKIEADPRKHLRKVDELYAASLQARRVRR